ncbi:MAG: ParB/RepB/Spo0J family partition protein [Rhizorhabdus sp.]|uniref:ParB/RepB/Spo0J family partition protein n=1 Tax=Rhizorhabdus sp. TaxID=1968843 RepID=UPI001B748750|nr:ParB/RepB/Spo0J family partition protein [Rhizorhabdus sp.]MBP8231551.1 ParB/RepB/Spo0J family partition protein [Rhizorhabdus sp.]
MSRKLQTGNLSLMKGAVARASSIFAVDESRSYREVRVDLLDPNPGQPRTYFDEGALQELAATVRGLGVLEPLLVREGDGGRYTIIAGERRWRAAGIAGLELVPVIVVSDDLDPAEVAVIENLQREDLSPVEEARALAKLQQARGLTHEQLGTMVGKSQGHITRTLALLRLPQEVLDGIEHNRDVSASALRAIADAGDVELQLKMWSAAIDGSTVRQLEAMKAGKTPGGAAGTANRSGELTFAKLINKFAKASEKGLTLLRERKAGGASLTDQDRARLVATRALIDDLLK